MTHTYTTFDIKKIKWIHIGNQCNKYASWLGRNKSQLMLWLNDQKQGIKNFKYVLLCELYLLIILHQISVFIPTYIQNAIVYEILKANKCSIWYTLFPCSHLNACPFCICTPSLTHSISHPLPQLSLCCELYAFFVCSISW